MRSWVIVGFNVQCWLLGWMVLGSFLDSMVMYVWVSHRIFVVKSCLGGCRKLEGGLSGYGSIDPNTL